MVRPINPAESSHFFRGPSNDDIDFILKSLHMFTMNLNAFFASSGGTMHPQELELLERQLAAVQAQCKKYPDMASYFQSISSKLDKIREEPSSEHLAQQINGIINDTDALGKALEAKKPGHHPMP
jgi:hypothetical protein